MEADDARRRPLDLDGVQALIATSANGVRAFAARDPRRSLPVCAVGDATARAASDAGFADVELGRRRRRSAGRDDHRRPRPRRRRACSTSPARSPPATSPAGSPPPASPTAAPSSTRCARSTRCRRRRARRWPAGRSRGVALYSPRTGAAVRGAGRRPWPRRRLRRASRLLPQRGGRRAGRASAVRGTGRRRTSGSAGHGRRHPRRCCGAILKLRIPAGYVSPSSGDPC